MGFDRLAQPGGKVRDLSNESLAGIPLAIGFELKQVIGIKILGAFKRAAGYAHRRQRQRPGYVWDGILDGLRVSGVAQAKEHERPPNECPDAHGAISFWG